MAQGTQKVLGGTPYKRYPDPNVKGSANEFGLYPWSAFKATLCDYQPGLAPIPFEGLNAQVYLLLFTSDVPARLELRTTDTGVLSGNAIQFSSLGQNTLSAPFLTTEPAGSTAATITKQGQVLFGYTGVAGQDYCSGFPAFAEAVVPGVIQGATYTEVICFANSPVISSPVGALSLSFDQAGNNAFAPVPVIILYGTYTKEIRDAGNLITLSDGSLYQVVGLWSN